MKHPIICLSRCRTGEDAREACCRLVKVVSIPGRRGGFITHTQKQTQQQSQHLLLLQELDYAVKQTPDPPEQQKSANLL